MTKVQLEKHELRVVKMNTLSKLLLGNGLLFIVFYEDHFNFKRIYQTSSSSLATCNLNFCSIAFPKAWRKKEGYYYKKCT
jgi:hypothetical protein